MVYNYIQSEVEKLIRSIVWVPGTGTDKSKQSLLVDLGSISTAAASVEVSPADESQTTEPTPVVQAVEKKLKPDTLKKQLLERQQLQQQLQQLVQQYLKPLQRMMQQFAQQQESQPSRKWERVSVMCQTTTGQEWQQQQFVVPVPTRAAQQQQLRRQLCVLARQLNQRNMTPLKQALQQAVQQQDCQQDRSPKWQVVLAPVTTTAGPQWRLVFVQQKRNAAIPCVLA